MAQNGNGVGQFTLEVIKENLLAIGDEMFVAMQRASMSPIIYETLDYATGLTDAKGQLITQGNGVALFLGTLDYSVRSALEKFGPEGLNPGDIVMTNDPYAGGGTHLSDVTLLMPIFVEGEIVAFSANKGHWTEVGGMAAGSWTTDSTEIYQEGLQFPVIKIFEEGVLDQGLVDLIRANVRTPDQSIGDMHAQAASVRVADRRFRDLCEKFGKDNVLKGIEALMDHSEKLIRQELKKIPPGVYKAVDTIDDDGITDDPIHVEVTVTVTDEKVICDFSGSDPQVAGPVNATMTGLQSAARAIMLALTDPLIPTNEGCFRILDVICPERTIFNAERPAAVSTYWETMLYAADLIWNAMAPLLPARLPAAHFLSVCAPVIVGMHPDTEQLYILVEPSAGGWGAGSTKDGEHVLFCVGDGETFTVPVEVCETRYGVLVDQFCFDITDGGAGEFRGGRGAIRDYRIISDGALFTATFGRFKYLPWGMDGGHEGSRNYFEIIYADGSEPLVQGKIARKPLQKGDVARLVTGTGGGYGAPFKRPVEKVVQDVRDGYITAEMAKKDYGVVVDPETLEVLDLVGGR